MSDDKGETGLVPKGTGAVEDYNPTSNRLIARVAAEALASLRDLGNLPKLQRHRIGDREFHEEDYRQLLIWAKERGLEENLEALLEELDQSFEDFNGAHTDDYLDYITSLCGIGRTGWSKGGRIVFFQLELEEDSDRPRLSIPKLAKLLVFIAYDCDLPALDLSGMPALRVLWCNQNQLADLNLSNVPGLRELDCSGNQLTGLDLSSVPDLIVFECKRNKLTELDLSCVPQLGYLDCGGNQLTELDLSRVPNLYNLNCMFNQLTELDLSHTPRLYELNCRYNQLTELDLSGMSELGELDCLSNQLSEIDIRCCLRIRTIKVDPGVILHSNPDQSFFSE